VAVAAEVRSVESDLLRRGFGPRTLYRMLSLVVKEVERMNMVLTFDRTVSRFRVSVAVGGSCGVDSTRATSISAAQAVSAKP